MASIQGNNQFRNSSEIAEYGMEHMVPLLTDGSGYVAGTHLQSPDFARDEKFLSVTRDPDDTIVHAHERMVLLLRHQQNIPDDTLICDKREALYALARAAEHTDVARRIELVLPQATSEAEEDALDNIANGFRFLQVAAKDDLMIILNRGRDNIRTALEKNPHVLQHEVRRHIFETFIRAQHGIPEDKRTVINWDKDNIDALLMHMGVGHARSVLRTNPDTATPEQMEEEVGAVLPPINRGLHYGTYVLI